MKHVKPFFGLPLILCVKINACDREDLFWSSHAFPHPPHNTFPHSRTSLYTFSSPPLDHPTLPHTSPLPPPHSIYPLSPSLFTSLPLTPAHLPPPLSAFPPHLPTPPILLPTSPLTFPHRPHLSPHFSHLSPHLTSPHTSPHISTHLLPYFSTPPKPPFTSSPLLSSPTPHLNTLPHISPHLPHTILHTSTHTFSHLPPHLNTHPHTFPSPPTPQHISLHLSPPFAYLPICSKLPVFPNVHLSQCSLIPKRPMAPKCPFPKCPFVPLHTCPQCPFVLGLYTHRPQSAHLLQMPICPNPHMLPIVPYTYMP